MSTANTEKNENNLEVVDISEGEDDVLVRLNSDSHINSTKIMENAQFSIMDAAIKSPDTSLLLQPVREEQRPNKLIRSRAPLNQQKHTTDAKYFLPVQLKTADIDSEFQSLGNARKNHNEEIGNTLLLNRMDSTISTQDGRTKLPLVQSNVTSFASPLTYFEPELVLSPAMLGQ